MPLYNPLYKALNGKPKDGVLRLRIARDSQRGGAGGWAFQLQSQADLLIRGFPKIMGMFWWAPQIRLQYFGVYVGVPLFRETTISCNALQKRYKLAC